MESTSSTSDVPRRLGFIEGYGGRKNEIIYHPAKYKHVKGYLIYFGGDMQDYVEKMQAHQNNKHYSQWDLETTALLLHNHFPDHDVVIVKPAKMSLMTFGCYENFVTVNNFGAPTYDGNTDSLFHLKSLLQNVAIVKEKGILELSTDTESILTSVPMILIGFSKGCVVLNQFLYSLHSMSDNSSLDILPFVENIKEMYWLDGGHSGSANTWVVDKSILSSFSKFQIIVHIHVTPYQVCCETRPRIGKEEKQFREILRRLDVNVRRKLHFENLSPSLELHFQILKVFKTFH